MWWQWHALVLRSGRLSFHRPPPKLPSVLPNPPTAGDKVSLPAAAVQTNSTPMSAPLAVAVSVAVSMPAAAVSAASTP